MSPIVLDHYVMTSARATLASIATDPEEFARAVSADPPLCAESFAVATHRKAFVEIHSWYQDHPSVPAPAEILRRADVDEGMACLYRESSLVMLADARREREQAELVRRATLDAQRRDFTSARANILAADALAKPSAQPPPPPVGIAPHEIAMRWANEGPLVRLATGIDALDRLCRGGLPVPWRVFIVGAPSAGKTAIETIIADHIARGARDAGACIGILAVDEEPDDITVRLAQIAGYSVADVEARDPRVMTRLAEALSTLRVRLYDVSWTIDAAAADLAAWCQAEGRIGVFFVDSLQTVRCNDSIAATSPRELVEANARAIRTASSTHRLLVIATSEANRSAYRNSQQAEQDDLAAGAESRAIEYGAQTQLVLRTPKGHPDIIHAKVAKNRRSDRGEFWLRLDRERHTVEECSDPNDEASTDAQDSKRSRNLALLDAQAGELLRIVVANAGIGERELRAKVREAGHTWGRDTLDAIKERLAKGLPAGRLVNRGDARASAWHIEATSEGGSHALD